MLKKSFKDSYTRAQKRAFEEYRTPTSSPECEDIPIENVGNLRIFYTLHGINVNVSWEAYVLNLRKERWHDGWLVHELSITGMPTGSDVDSTLKFLKNVGQFYLQYPGILLKDAWVSTWFDRTLVVRGYLADPIDVIKFS